jgi:hypothetical protein
VADSSVPTYDRSETWVPVEQRWLGLDRRSFIPAAIVAALGILLGGILPLIDQAVSWDDPIVAGDKLDLGGGITVTPPTGWQLESGVRVGGAGANPADATAIVTSNGVSVTVQVSGFSGSPGELLDRVNDNEFTTATRPDLTAVGGRNTLVTGSGLSGVSESYTGTSAEGLAAAFTFPANGSGITADTGMSIVVDAPRGQLSAVMPDVQAMLRSVSVEERR